MNQNEETLKIIIECYPYEYAITLIHEGTSPKVAFSRALEIIRSNDEQYGILKSMSDDEIIEVLNQTYNNQYSRDER